MIPNWNMDTYYGQMDAYIALTLCFIGIVAVLLVFSLISYIFASIGLAGMAKYRGIRKYGLAWLPIGNAWILGSLSDQYRHVVKGKICCRRKTLLGLSIAMYAITVVEEAAAYLLEQPAMLQGLPVARPLLIAVTALLACAALVLSVILTVHTYIAYHDVFVSANPDTGVTLLVLGIIFPFLLPFFLFASRKKEYGMPPRRPVQE